MEMVHFGNGFCLSVLSDGTESIPKGIIFMSKFQKISAGKVIPPPRTPPPRRLRRLDARLRRERATSSRGGRIVDKFALGAEIASYGPD